MALWFDERAYPTVPCIVNLLMDPMEKMTPDSEGMGYIGRKMVAEKLWAQQPDRVSCSRT